MGLVNSVENAIKLSIVQGKLELLLDGEFAVDDFLVRNWGVFVFVVADEVSPKLVSTVSQHTGERRADSAQTGRLEEGSVSLESRVEVGAAGVDLFSKIARAAP